MPNDHKNLAYRAAQLMVDTYNIKEGVTITIDKDIPVSAGLAGGSGCGSNDERYESFV